MHRRDFVQLGVAAGAVSLSQLTGCASAPSAARPAFQASGSHDGIAYFRRFGVDEEIVRTGIAAAMSRGADYADLFFEHRVESNIALEDGAVTRASSSVTLGVGVRAVKGDQTGYGYTEELTADAIQKAALTAASIASGPARSTPRAFRVEGRLPQRYALKRGWQDVRVDEKMPFLTRLNEAMFRADKRVKRVNARIGDSYGAVLIADSQGRIVEDLQPMTSLGVDCVAEQNGRREANGRNISGRAGIEFYSDERLDRLVKKVIANTMVLFEAGAAPAGEMPVVLAAGGSGILLHEAIGHGMEADFNRKRTSIYSDKIGKSVAHKFVNIVDDGTVDNARGAINVDDEGNLAQKTMLVEDGVLTTYLHDSISAKHYGVKATGNGRRESFRNMPMPRMRATYMLPGPHKEAEIIASVKRGIYCSNFANGEVNIGAGDFTFFVKNGYLIEDGKLTRPIKDVNVIGNGPRALEKIDMVADDLVIDEGGWTCGKNGQSVPVSQGIPTVRVASLTVGGRGA